MAVGDAAQTAGWPIVPDTGEDGKVKYGAREINRTRDLAATMLTSKVWPVDRGGTGATTPVQALANLGITVGTANPSGGKDGDIYIQIITG